MIGFTISIASDAATTNPPVGTETSEDHFSIVNWIAWNQSQINVIWALFSTCQSEISKSNDLFFIKEC